MSASENGREMAIDALQASLDKLIAQQDQVNRDVNAVTRAMEVLKQEEKSGVLTKKAAREYAGLGAGNAVTKFLQEHAGRRYRASEVKNQLDKRGFQTTAKAVGSLIHATLGRLAKSDKNPIQETKRNNVKVYWIEKQPARGVQLGDFELGRLD